MYKYEKKHFNWEEINWLWSIYNEPIIIITNKREDLSDERLNSTH
jgi:hypothetical protein